jgi:protein-disulfide isomerase
LLTVLTVVPVRAAPPTVEAAMAERSLGRADAKVVVIEYASLTCPHCASFHRDVLPEVKKKYIDTGKIRWVYRDFPLDGRATVAAMAARCAPKDRYFPFLDALFKSQEQWARAPDVHVALAPIARLAGLSQADYDACVKNEALVKAIANVANEAQAQFQVKSTPSFVSNGKKIELGTSFKSADKALGALIK